MYSTKCEFAKRRYEWTKKYFASRVEGARNLPELTNDRRPTDVQRPLPNAPKQASKFKIRVRLTFL